MDEQPGPPARRGSWPLTGLDGTLGQARGHTRRFLEEPGPPPPLSSVQDALVLVVELVSNAVRHAPGPCVLGLCLEGRLLRISVSDTSSSLPEPRTADLDGDGGGFGWHLLHTMADRLEIEHHGGRGKTVTAVLTLRPH
ncbi:ATP-binding protein [Streptacidiphilus sp. N1-3]|uniref:ATP-binding protein n=1 Tax=Streptacidiphilus alkalitolerans TaxID=3342712 RepID=A0ABV6WZZ5_9ACTN